MKKRFSNLLNLASQARQTKDEEGQGLIELTVAVAWLAIVIIVSFEFAMVFASYMALLNSARAGSRYASTHPEILSTPGVITDDKYDGYNEYISDEAYAADLRTSNLAITIPQTNYDTDGNPIVSGGQPVTVTLYYSLTTFTSGIRLPFVGRFGLPNVYRISASASFPIGGT